MIPPISIPEDYKDDVYSSENSEIFFNMSFLLSGLSQVIYSDRSHVRVNYRMEVNIPLEVVDIGIRHGKELREQISKANELMLKPFRRRDITSLFVEAGLNLGVVYRMNPLYLDLESNNFVHLILGRVPNSNMELPEGTLFNKGIMYEDITVTGMGFRNKKTRQNIISLLIGFNDAFLINEGYLKE